MFQRFLVWLFRGCARRPVVTLVVLVALTGGAMAGLRHLKFADLFESFFGGNNDAWTYYQQLTRTFVTDQIVAVGLEPPGELFTRPNLQAIRRLSRRLETLPHVKSVTALTNVKYFREGVDRFSSEPLVPEAIPAEPAALAQIKKRALGEPLYVGGILSPDGRMAAIHVHLASGLGTADREATVGAIARVITESRPDLPGWLVPVTGDPWFTYHHQLYMARDLAVLTPATMLVLFIVMLVVLRRLTGAALTMLGCVAFMVMATALLVATRGTMNGCTTMIPPFAVIMAVTVVVHFLNEFRLSYLRHRDRAVALDHVVGELSAPIYYANFSTAVGFFSLAVSSIPAVREFGIAMGLGMILIVFVLMAYSTAITRLVPPERLIVMSPRAAEQSLTSTRIFERLGLHVFRHRRAWLVLIALSSGVTLYGVSRIRIETNTLEMFHQRDPLYQDAVLYGKRFGGVSSIYIALDGAKTDALLAPEALARLEQIERFLTAEIGAGYTLSLTKYVKTMHRAFFDGDQTHYAIPPSKEGVAQLLLLNTDETIRDVVNEGHSRGVIVAWINEHSSTKLLHMQARIQRFLAGLPQDHFTFRVSGTVMLDTQLTDDVARSTFQSLLLAMAVIFLLRLVQFRHFTLGLLSLLPNAFPIWSTFGLMGLFGLPLNVSTAMSATVVLGIADDETIHFFAGYQAQRRHGLDARAAVLATLQDKGSSIFFSTVVVTLGFSTLFFSNYGPTVWFGLVLSIAFMVSIFANVVFGPALLDWLRPIRDPEVK